MRHEHRVNRLPGPILFRYHLVFDSELLCRLLVVLLAGREGVSRYQVLLLTVKHVSFRLLLVNR